MKEQIEHMNSDLDILKWYTTFMEDGVDAKKIGLLYADLKEEYREFVENSELEISQHKAEAK